MINNNDWKYLLRELVLTHPPSKLAKRFGVSKVSIYKWIRGEAIPHKKFHKKIMKTAKEPKRLIIRNRGKEISLKKLAQKKFKACINVASLVYKDFLRRQKSNANSWYLQKVSNKEIRVLYFDSKKNWKSVIVPTKIALEQEFMAIIGFWLGDGTTKNSLNCLYRPYVSLTNVELPVIEHLVEFAKNSLLQEERMFDVEVVYGSLSNKNKLDLFVEGIKQIGVARIKMREHGNWNGFGAILHIRNVPLSLVFSHALSRINLLVKESNKLTRGAFLGGYFTAEGNISKINGWFSFHEKHKDRRKIIKDTLEGLAFSPTDLGDRVNIAHKKDIREKDFRLFKRYVLPYIFSKEKTKKTNELFAGKFVRKIDIIYLLYLYLHPGTTSDEISQAFCKNRDHVVKVYRRLHQTGLVNRERKEGAQTDFFRLFLTEKGRTYVIKHLNEAKELLGELKRLKKHKRLYRNTFSFINPNTNEPVPALNEICTSYQ